MNWFNVDSKALCKCGHKFQQHYAQFPDAWPCGVSGCRGKPGISAGSCLAFEKVRDDAGLIASEAHRGKRSEREARAASLARARDRKLG